MAIDFIFHPKNYREFCGAMALVRADAASITMVLRDICHIIADKLLGTIAQQLNIVVIPVAAEFKKTGSQVARAASYAKGSSHPKSNLKRPKIVQNRHVPGPALLVDDVATSGVHLSEASNILKQSGTDSLQWFGLVEVQTTNKPLKKLREKNVPVQTEPHFPPKALGQFMLYSTGHLLSAI